MHLVLAHHHSLRTEPFDDGADMRANARGSDEDGELAHLRLRYKLPRRFVRYLRLLGAKVPSIYGPSADDQRF